MIDKIVPSRNRGLRFRICRVSAIVTLLPYSLEVRGILPSTLACITDCPLQQDKDSNKDEYKKKETEKDSFNP